MASYIYGIDFGTSNSALSIFDEEKNEIVDTISIPSVLYFSSNGSETTCTVGSDAICQYISDGMKGRFMKSIKRVLPRSSFVDTRIGSNKYTATDLATFIIKELKEMADKRIGQSCTKAILGRPVFFDDDDTRKDALAQKRLMNAAFNAGLEDIEFQFEPIGAAFAYEKSLTKKERVLVADLGGGTTDFTIINLDPAKSGSKNRREDIVATGGIYIGGDSFDSSFMWDRGTPYFGRGVQYESGPGKFLDLPLSLFANICSWEKMNFFNGQKIRNDIDRYFFLSKNNPKFENLITLIENNLGYTVFREIEKTKIELSGLNQTRFHYNDFEILLDEEITLEQYNQIINKDLTKINNYLDSFLNQYQIKPEEIDSIFLTGGTSLVQAIQDLFKTKFPKTPINSGDNFISVAKGLAYSGYLFE
ncbi:MAG: Hsp70 family protein [Bacteroidia bacterium]|nr:Hsp70 family protein [Bacteroidia bacterium]MCF8445346.1 Hsp70 family protein [Bacteroidia bacterium]